HCLRGRAGAVHPAHELQGQELLPDVLGTLRFRGARVLRAALPARLLPQWRREAEGLLASEPAPLNQCLDSPTPPRARPRPSSPPSPPASSRPSRRPTPSRSRTAA